MEEGEGLVSRLHAHHIYPPASAERLSGPADPQESVPKWLPLAAVHYTQRIVIVLSNTLRNSTYYCHAGMALAIVIT